MWQQLKRAANLCVFAASICLVNLFCEPVLAGWGHHHHHYHWGYGYPVSYSYVGHGYRYGGLSSWYGLYPSWGNYTSISVNLRPRLLVPSYRVRYYSSYSLPSVYYAPSVYVAPTYYVAPIGYPTYYYPSYYVDPCAPAVPTCANTYSTSYWPDSIDTSPVLPTYSTGTSSNSAFVDRMLASRQPSYNTPSYNTPTYGSPAQHSPASVTNPSSIAGTSSSSLSRFVSTADTSATLTVTTTPIPNELLLLADQMFANGGYAEAAAAYARLAVRHGNHKELMVRRFIALVANGDHAQAAVLMELSMVDNQAFSVDSLPHQALAGLYGQLASNREKHIDSLAKYALGDEKDAVRMKMVGVWLDLDGQAQRAEVFHQRAAEMNPSSTIAQLPIAVTHLADAQVAR